LHVVNLRSQQRYRHPRAVANIAERLLRCACKEKQHSDCKKFSAPLATGSKRHGQQLHVLRNYRGQSCVRRWQLGS
jgi:hypothetical protein